MIRRPPRSTPFPTRRSSDLLVGPGLEHPARAHVHRVEPRQILPGDHPAPRDEAVRLARSEEHTSELQSRLHLVCRLLLEKKKRIYEYKFQYTDSRSSTIV